MTSLALALALLGPAAPPSPEEILGALETAVGDAIARAERSVVAISRERDKGGGDEETSAIRGRESKEAPSPLISPFAQPGEREDEESSNDFGSGVVIGPEGAILTNFHVVKGASRLRVRAPGLKHAFDAEVLAADPRSDLAVISPRAASPNLPAPDLKPLPLGDAARLRKGSFLLALGNPFNAARDGNATASWGILANFARKVQPPPGRMGTREKQLRNYPTLLQLDSKLNLGMSGGAVVNLKGELVGITTAGGDPSGFDALAGYAIPLDALGRRAVEALRVGKEVEYGFIGIGLDEVSPETNRINVVIDGSPAERGGLKPGDLILAVGGLPVVDSDSLTLAVNSQPVGQPVKLTIRRLIEPPNAVAGDHPLDQGREAGEGPKPLIPPALRPPRGPADGLPPARIRTVRVQAETLEKVVVLSKFPVLGEVIATNRPTAWRGLRVDFLSALPETFQREVLDAMALGGVGVVGVRPNSPADAAGLKVGLIVKAVNGKEVRTPSDFAEAVAQTSGSVKIDTLDRFAEARVLAPGILRPAIETKVVAPEGIPAKP